MRFKRRPTAAAQLCRSSAFPASHHTQLIHCGESQSNQTRICWRDAALTLLNVCTSTHFPHKNVSLALIYFKMYCKCCTVCCIQMCPLLLTLLDRLIKLDYWHLHVLTVVFPHKLSFRRLHHVKKLSGGSHRPTLLSQDRHGCSLKFPR